MPIWYPLFKILNDLVVLPTLKCFGGAIILKLFIIYDKDSDIKNPDKCFTELEKIIDEYQDSLSKKNLRIFFNRIIIN